MNVSRIWHRRSFCLQSAQRSVVFFSQLLSESAEYLQTLPSYIIFGPIHLRLALSPITMRTTGLRGYSRYIN